MGLATQSALKLPGDQELGSRFGSWEGGVGGGLLISLFSSPSSCPLPLLSLQSLQTWSPVDLETSASPSSSPLGQPPLVLPSGPPLLPQPLASLFG